MHHLVRKALAFATIALLASCGAPATPDGGGSAPDAVIVGALTDAAGAPLVGQQVTLTPADAPSPGSMSVDAITASAAAVTTTDARGAFGFDVTEPGTFVLTNLGDTTGAMARVTVERGSDGRLTSGGTVGMTALELGAVSGRVEDRGAGVLVFLAATSFVAMTGSDGTFVISRVPAGSYEAVASVAGAIGAPVPVTVAAGGVAALASDLRVGPVITGVTPSGFVPAAVSPVGGGTLADPTELVITGSGFGGEPGVARLTYAGCEVPFVALEEWSDARIVVDLVSLVNDLRCARSAVDADELRFGVATVAGTAWSPVTGAHQVLARWPQAYWYEPKELATPVPVEIALRVLPWFDAEGITFSLEAMNGAIQTAAGAPLNEWTTTEFSYGENPSFQVLPSTWLPVVLTLDPTVDDRVTGDPHRVVVRGGSILLDDSSFVPGLNTFSGTVLAADEATPMPDDGNFSLRFFRNGWGNCGPGAGEESVEGQALAIAGDGTWSVDVSLPDIAGWQVALMYDGVWVACQSLWLQE